MDMGKGEVLKFTRTKEYIFQESVGNGGTGKTVLLKDDILDMLFVCKKYEPCEGNDKEDCFNRFKDEIKILYRLSHNNIVRVYTYFLYPDQVTGYILMEYIKGKSIDDYLLFGDEDTFENIFIQLIEGFEYLEKNGVIHRDIKPNNILVTENGIVKIIDFGFGKRIETQADDTASILLNWNVDQMPNEIYQGRYSSKTDIYFLGKMFQQLLDDSWLDSFKYQDIIDKMINRDDAKRIQTFTEIRSLISKGIMQQMDFSEKEKTTYSMFATALVEHIIHYNDEAPKIRDKVDTIILNLEKLLARTSLEKFLQNNSKLIECFINGKYTYSNIKDIEVAWIADFYKLIKAKPSYQQKIIIDNITTRLSAIDIEVELPF